MEMLSPVTGGPVLGLGNTSLTMISPSGWWLRPGQRAVVVVGLALLEGAGLLLNLAIFTAFAREGAGRSAGGALPINLVVADLLTTGCVLPLLIRFFHTAAWPFGSAGCQVFGFTFQLFGGVSIYTMTAIAIERHYTITHGNQGISKLTRQQGKFVAASWMLSLTLAVPPLFGWSSYHMDPETGTCAPDWTTMDWQHGSYLVFLAVFGFLLPIVIQAGCYLKLCNTVFSVARRARASEMSFLQSTMAVITIPMATLAHGSAQPFFGESHQMSTGPALGSAMSMLLKRKAEFQNLRRLAKLMISMVLVQIMSWLPYIVGLLVVFVLEGEAHPQALTFTMMISTFNIIYNPVMYVYHNRKYRGTVSRCLLPVTSRFRKSCQREQSDDEDDDDDNAATRDQGNAPARPMLDHGRTLPLQGTHSDDFAQNRQSPNAEGSLDNERGIFLLPSQKLLISPYPNLYTIKERSHHSHSGFPSDSKPTSSYVPVAIARPQSGFQFTGSRPSSMVKTPLGFNTSDAAGRLPAERGDAARQ